MGLQSEMLVSNQACLSPMDLRSGISVFLQVCRFLTRHGGLPQDMVVSHKICQSQFVLRWVSDKSPIVLIFSLTLPLPRYKKCIIFFYSTIDILFS